MSAADARALLGALLLVPGALEACRAAEVLDPEAFAGDERLALLGLLSVRVGPQPAVAEVRLLAWGDWMRARGLAPVPMLKAAAFAWHRGGPLTPSEAVDLARRVCVVHQPEARP